MTSVPQPGDVWFVDFGYDEKPRHALVLSVKKDARLALATVVTITKQFGGTPYEVTLPRVPWLREQSYINAQSLQPVQFSEFARKAPGRFDERVIEQVRKSVRDWLSL
ncbi:MAG TPA: type II toxin-antitoxin system PemK/MazF family toxin [Verrucomicrobiota bacterium]|nr:type II toxin-antitoxin system PemK/MazF family toxin [Verrucomicrobiota bacterium]